MGHYILIVVLLVSVMSLRSQTPFDSYAPEHRDKVIIELENEEQFRVENSDSESQAHYAEFDNQTLCLNILDSANSIIATIVLAPDDKKFLSVDPLSDKYPSTTPYAYCNNNPVMFVDPDGREGIVVSSNPGKENMDQHFLINGLDRAKAAQNRPQKGENVTWFIYNSNRNGYNPEYLDKYTAEAAKAGINVRVVSDVNEIVNYINNKNGGTTRAEDLISSFYYVGHATPGDLDVGYQGSGEHFDPSDLNSSAFRKGAWVNLVGGCRTATPYALFLEKSVVRQFQDILDVTSKIHGSDVRVDYPGGVAADRSLLRENKGKIITVNGKLKK